MIVGTPELSDLFSRLMSPTFWGSLLEDWPDRFSRLGYWLIGLDREALGNLDHWEFKFANPWPILLVFLTVALLGIYAIWQYGKEPMAGHSRARKFLSVIRMILLYWAFFLLAQPTLILERDAENPSRLAVMLDGSMSMTVPEKYDQKEDLDIWSGWALPSDRRLSIPRRRLPLRELVLRCH